MNLIEEAIRKIFLYISIFIYQLITNLYEIFERLCKSRILDTDTLNSISQRIGMLLGIVMLFFVSFSIIQMILEPEKLTDKEKGIGNIAKKIILVIVMLGMSNFVFNTLYSVQTRIIDSHILSKFLLPYEAELENFGGVLSAELFTTYFKARDSEYEDKIKLLKAYIISDNDFSLATEWVDDNDGVFGWGNFKIDFNFLLCPLLGLGALYFLFNYCITVGIRTIQLAFLEIISPMAIVSYLSPKKDTMFEKWWKVYSATYIDVFIRIMIINLVVFLIAAILDSDMSLTFWNSVGTENNGSDTMIKIFMILALLTFAKKAPDLLKDLFPAGASKLGFGASMKDIVGLNAVVGGIAGNAIGSLGRIPGAFSDTAKAIGMIRSASGWRNKVKAAGNAFGTAIGSTVGVATGGVTGAFRGGVEGFKSKGGIFSAAHAGQQGASKANLGRGRRQLAGGHWYDSIGKGFNSFTGNLDEYEILEEEVRSYSDLKADIDGEDIVKDAQTTLDIAYQEYYRNNPGGLSKTEWLESGNPGAAFKTALDNAKQAAYNNLYANTNSAFHVKVNMHNRRFRTKYGTGSDWKDINQTRKDKSAELEKIRAKKPKN